MGAHDLITVGAGSLVGFTLGLIGSGGSILAVPLLIYAVGVPSPHVAIGTSAVAVAASAAVNLAGHARAHTVKWPCAIVFALAGVAGAAIGATLGKVFDGTKLLALFGALMVLIGGLMLLPREAAGDPNVRLRRENAARLLPLLIGGGLAIGGLSGFFGIGGGFLIVPGLIGVTAMPLINAIGSSLVSVTAFGTTAAASYAYSGLVEWKLAGLFIVGGVLGSAAGLWLSKHLATYKRALSTIFASVVIAVGIYVVAAAVIRA
jgi:uncharacterized protein